MGRVRDAENAVEGAGVDGVGARVGGATSAAGRPVVYVEGQFLGRKGLDLLGDMEDGGIVVRIHGGSRF